MAVKFLEILNDPYTNESNEFVLVLGIGAFYMPVPSAPGSGSVGTGFLKDPNGQTVAYFIILGYQDYEVTGSLSDEAFAHSYAIREVIAIPPGWKFTNFVQAYGLQGTLEELAPFIRGM